MYRRGGQLLVPVSNLQQWCQAALSPSTRALLKALELKIFIWPRNPVGIICRTVLVMSDMKARLTSRVVPPYTSYTGHTVAAAAAW